MALFTIADLHLSGAQDHPMDVFGARWQDYMKKIADRWRRVVRENDTVVIPGDISWAMNLEGARLDFAFLDALPGKKLLGKGNHDFWWDTATKCNRFFEECGFHTLSLLYNNAYVVEDFIVCGTRGWFLEKTQQITVGEVDYEKISNRERERLKLSLDAAKRLQVGEHENKEIVVFLHFPPLFGEFISQEMLDLMNEYGVKRCYFGHIHGKYNVPQMQKAGDLELSLISSDYLDFYPRRILPSENA
ncbi:MAG: metallophosphoesterase [Clostridia bacterium]|nr:metallophosphoesterase [Clostridia bacterium]